MFDTFGLIVRYSGNGWSLHLPDLAQANGLTPGPALACGTGKPTQADYDLAASRYGRAHVQCGALQHLSIPVQQQE